MGRGAAAAATRNTEAGAGQNATYFNQGQDAFNTVFPQLVNQANQGLSPADKASLNTASQQSLGGTNASAVGAGGLAATRTRNAGAMAPALAAAAQSAQRQNSANALGTEGKSIAMKQAALSALEGLYGTSSGAGNQALQGSNQALEQWNKADANTQAWMKMVTDLAGSAADAFGSYQQNKGD